MKRLFVLLVFASPNFLSAQADGYWDNARATTREIVVGAGDRIVVKTEDFPIGTTELAYRVTLLDENQQMASSLVSILKAIPDPSGISQGSAGAVFLMSKISGDDKCTYAAFPTSALATKYEQTGKPDGACLVQSEPVSKDARLLSPNKMACLKTNALWFGFESHNWVFKEKIVLEVVPWVDNKKSRGWNDEAKNAVLELCKTSGLAGLMLHPDDLCLSILDKFRNGYTYSEYQKMSAAEKSKAYRDFGNACLDPKTADQSLLATVRNDAYQHFRNKAYDKAIDLLTNAIVDRGNARAKDYYALGTYYLFSRQTSKALDAFRKGEKLDPSELLIQLGIANAYLVSGDFSAAKEIHKKYRTENVSAKKSWIDQAKEDIDALQKAGIQSDDFDRMLKYLKGER